MSAQFFSYLFSGIYSRIKRRVFLSQSLFALGSLLASKAHAYGTPDAMERRNAGILTLFLGGDVMTGRDIDQILPYADDPHIYEPYMRSARGYIEVYRNRLILYGCGDLLNDYEGIGGHEQFRSDLALMYFADIEAMNGQLVRCELAPFRLKRLRLKRADTEASRWLKNTLDRECSHFGCRVELSESDTLRLRWNSTSL